MTSRQRQTELATQLERVLDYCRDEYNMTYAEVCGVLGMLKTHLEVEGLRVAEGEDEEADAE